MLLTTILNQCYRFKGFVYGQAQFVRYLGQQNIEVLVRPRKACAWLNANYRLNTDT